MNKVFSLFMICAMAVSLTAADTIYFNRYQFQPGAGEFKDGAPANEVKDLAALTVPFVYSGNLKLTGYGAADNDWINYEYNDNDCFVGTQSLNLPIYMTICQPCLDCYPCTVLGQEENLRVLDNKEKVGTCDDHSLKALVGSITRWNLYVVEKYKYDKKEYVYIHKINLLTKDYADGVYNHQVQSVFFTGRKGSGNDSYAYAQYKGVDGKHNAITQFAMVGKKNDYKFKYTVAKMKLTDGKWTWKPVTTNNKETTATAYIKSATKFDGVFCIGQMYGDHGQFIQAPVVYPQVTLPYPYDATDYNQITKVNAVDTYGNYYGFQYCGEIKLTRNASLTNAAIKGAFGVEKAKTVQNWEDCVEDTPASYCEEYFTINLGDKMDVYLAEKVYKSYDKDDRLDWDETTYGGVKWVDHSIFGGFFEDAVKSK